MPPKIILPAMTINRKQLIQFADWAAVAVAISLPWSTSATSILLVIWLLALLAVLDFATLKRQAQTAAGGLPILLWLLAAVGMFWAATGWSDRVEGLGGFHRLLMIPLLLAQFRRSDRGQWVLCGFLASAALLLFLSWLFAFDPGLAWPRHNAMFGVPVKDDIAQSTIFLLCAFALVWRACDLLRMQAWKAPLLLAALAILFLANLVFVATSRADLTVVPFLAIVLGWRQFRWRGIIVAVIATSILAAAAWSSSPYLRARVIAAVEDVQDYSANHVSNDVGDHIEFLKKSLSFIGSAPFFGHGTGSIADLFRRSAAGQAGAAGVASVNPHSQYFGVAIQLGLLGTIVLLAMYAAHYLLFRAAGLTAWIGTIVVVQNVVSSLTSSHLFDFTHGWLYVFGVGVAGGMMHRVAADPAASGPEGIAFVPRNAR
jgi:O-antigen ligase